MTGGQRSLFGPPPAAEQVLLDDRERNCRVRFWERFVPRDEATALFEHLMATAPLEPETVVVGGKAILTRRRSCAFGEPGLVYRYVGAVRHAHPWPVPLLPILERIRAEARCTLDFALCGLYPDGEADLGYHSDDETDLEPGAPIASLSLGAERDFCFRRRAEDAETHTTPLPHGSLLAMEGMMQREYVHSIPKRLRVREPRINLTMRRMRTR